MCTMSFFNIFLLFLFLLGTHSSTGCVTEKSCNFAHDVCGFGGAQINGHNYWSRTDGWWGIPHRVGPYAILRKGPRDQSHTAHLTSPPLCGAASVTVSFTYVITHPSCELRVLTQCQGHESGGETIRHIASYSKTWQRKNVTLPACPHSDVTVIFRGTLNPYSTTSVALGDIVIKSAKPTTPKPTTTTHRPTTATHSRPTTTTATPKTTPTAADFAHRTDGDDIATDGEPHTTAGTHSSTGCVTEKSCNFAHDLCGFGGAQINGHNYWSTTDGWWGIPHRVGPYAILRKGPRDQSHTADLKSPALCGAASVTVFFTYVITHPSCELHVLTQCQGHEAGGDTVKYLSVYAKTWLRKNVTLPACPHSDVTVIFRGTLNPYSTTSVALSDIVITSAQATTTQKPNTTTHKPTTATHKPTTAHKPTTTHKPTTHKPTTTTRKPTTTHKPTTTTHKPTTTTHKPTTTTHDPSSTTARPKPTPTAADVAHRAGGDVITTDGEPHTTASTTALPNATTTGTTSGSVAVSTESIRHDITCGHAEMSFSIPVPSELSLPQTVTLSDSRCRVDTGGNHLTGRTFLNDCGTTVSFTNDTIIFSNAIYLSFANNASNVNRVIPLECRYERVSELHLSYLPIVRRVLFTETGVGQFGFRIEQFKDDSFSAAARVADSAYPLRTTPSEAIFVQLSLEDADLGHGRFGMVVEGCVASPSSSMVAASNGTYEKLIEGGCPASSDVYLIRNHNATRHDNLSRHFRFSFKAVTFPDSQGRASAGLVYIHCRVRLCPPHACPPRSRACPLPASFHVRERRAVSESGDRVVGHHQLSTGPLLVVGDSGESAAVSSSSSVPLIVLGAIAASATLLAAAVLVAWTRARRGEGHRQLKVTTGLE